MIVYDLQAVQSAAHGERGIARYVAELASALARRHPDVVDAFAFNDRLPHVGRLDTLQLGGRLQPFSALRGQIVDVVHVNSPFELLPIHEVQLPVRAQRTVATCYDLIPQIFPHVYLEDSSTKARYQTRLQMLLAADEIVTDSESAAADVARLLRIAPNRLTSLGAGVSSGFVPPTTPLADRLAQLQETIPRLRAGYVFVPTGMDWRKNIDGALESFARLPDGLRRRHQLVIACRMNQAQMEHLAWQCRTLGVTDDEVVVTGFVSDPDLVLLYQSSELVFFPSYYEGFGLPVLEARRCGARVICSNTASLPEVLPDHAAQFNPYDRAEMAAKLTAALTDPGYKEVLDAVPDPQFSWELAADRLVEVYERVRESPLRPGFTQNRRPRIAMVTVLPPTPSGIADHSARLLSAMQEFVDVTAVVNHDVTRHAEQWPFDVVGLRTLPSRWAVGEFDHVVYCLGNNALHSAFLPMIERVPGIVFAHDVRLVGCVSAAEQQGIWGRDADDPSELDDAGNDLSFGILSITRRVNALLVNSAHAANIVQQRTDATAINIGPHPLPDGVTVVPNPSKDDVKNHLVISAGIADVTKGSDVVAEAFERLVEQRDDTSGVIVGLGSEAFAAASVPTAPVLEVAGVSGSTGAVGDDEFDAWLAGCSVAVQLRVVTNGESSGVVAQTLARGVPTIVSDVGALSELPDDVVVKVPVDISGAQLAEVIAKLLDDVGRRQALRTAAVGFAQRETYAVGARRLIEAVVQSAG
jgi:glycosyltransferase involved in cell wall biosynthesis